MNKKAVWIIQEPDVKDCGVIVEAETEEKALQIALDKGFFNKRKASGFDVYEANEQTISNFYKTGTHNFSDEQAKTIATDLIKAVHSETETIRKEVIKELRTKLSRINCSVSESAFSYAMKLDAEFDRLFTEYGVKEE